MKRVLAVLTFFLAGLLAAWPQAFGQTGGRSATGDVKQSAPKVLLRSSLDPAFFQKEIAFVNYVQTEDEAQVLVEITSRKTDAGEEFSLILTGQKEFAGVNDVLRYTAAPNMTPDEAKPEVARLLKLGLLRYVSKTPIAGRISLAFKDQVKPTAVVDPWNFWVFSLSVNTFLNGEETYKMRNIFGNFSASRVTPEWKLRFSVSGSSSKSTFSVGDYNYESSSESLNFNGMVVKSISDHWSVGASLGMSSSTYSNIKLNIAPSAAVEYDLFPYSESTKRQLRILYSVGINIGRYRELTIYDKMKETHLRESLDITLEFKQPWGTISTSLDGSHYFYDLKKNRISLDGEISLRIWKGLNFNFYGGGSRIHDQIFLAKGEASLEEVLLQRRQLETTYNYFFSVGLSFSFGSIYSNVVNPRFGSGSGTSISIQM